jgi:pimeloyl-ACP methyl ester carboxylesterase
MECNIGDISFFYESYGTGTPIILLHGYGSDHRLMTGCMEPIFAQQPEWRRIYLDLPGMGKTPGREHIQSSDDVLDVVVSFIDAVVGEQPFLIVGESYGGYLARGIVLRKFKQVAGMALVCPGIIAERSRRDVPPRTIIVENPRLLATLDPGDAAEFDATAVVQDEGSWQRFRDDVLRGARVADRPLLEKVRQRLEYSFDVDKLQQPFPGPVVFLLGRQDSMVGYRDAWNILENYPRATFVVLDRAGHNLQIEQPQLFHALISEWLDRVQESRRS